MSDVFATTGWHLRFAFVGPSNPQWFVYHYSTLHYSTPYKIDAERALAAQSSDSIEFSENWELYSPT